jgi:cell volume regulation protein A
MGAGLILGLLFARVTLFILTKIRLQYEGIYPVLVLAMVLLSYSMANVLHGNGFLAVYVLGIVLGSSDFNRKRALLNFYDGIAWLMQIAMFLALGLLVLPSMIFANALNGLFIALALMFVARPLSVFISLIGFNMTTQKKAMVSWVGLRGAAPIILATFPLLAGVANAGFIFNIVFFVVIASVIIQGTTISAVADALKVSAPYQSGRRHPLEFEKSEAIDAMLTDIMVPYNSQCAGKSIFNLHAPEGCLIVLLARADKYIVPSGSTIISEGDVILTLANKEALEKLRAIVTRLKETQSE